MIGVLEGAISSLRATTGRASFALSLVATAAPVELEPLAWMPAPGEQPDQLLRVIRLTTQPADRQALIQVGLSLIAGTAGVGAEIATIRRSLEDQLRQERAVNERYRHFGARTLTRARRAAAAARIADVERIYADIAAQDAKLGRQRQEIVLAVQGAVLAHIEAAVQLRLLRHRWALRQELHRGYQRSSGAQLLQLVKVVPPPQAIRRLEGPGPSPLQTLPTRLSGGAERLARQRPPDDLRPVHELLISAWRFAESAAARRFDAVVSGDAGIAREASSAAAGALLLLSRTQQESRTFLEPPRLP